MLALLFIVFLAWKKNTRKRIGEPRLVEALLSGYSPRLFLIRYVLAGLALATGILAAMNPGRIGGKDSLKRKGIDIAIVLDVSNSMLAADLAPSRLERAKQFVTKLMDDMPDDRFALVLFAGKAYLQMPLTTDHGAASLFVSAAGPEAIARQGTVLAEALEMGSRAFNKTDKRFKTILLITDGEDHDRNAAGTAKDLARQGIMILTVGVGSANGSTIPDPLTGTAKTDATGNTIVSRLNEEILKEIAATTNGVYINLKGSEESVALVKKQLSQIERKAFSDISQMNFQGMFVWLSGIMFLLLATELFIPGRKMKTL